MSAKYYTQFRLTDANYRGGNEFSGVIELSRPMDGDSDVADIEAVLAKNFDLQQSAVQLVSWSLCSIRSTNRCIGYRCGAGR